MDKRCTPLKSHPNDITKIGDENEATITVFSRPNVVTILNENLIPVKQVEIMDLYGRLVWIGVFLIIWVKRASFQTLFSCYFESLNFKL